MAKGRNKSKRKVKRVDPDAKKAEIEADEAETEEDEPTSPEEDEGFDDDDDDDDEEAAAAGDSLADLSPAERRAERRRRRIERRAKERARAAGDDVSADPAEPTEVNTTGGLVFVGVILALLAAAVVVAFLTK